MWRDKVTQRYHWAGIHDKFEELIFELTKAEEEEEVGLYLLRLHYDNEIDLDFFNLREKERIKKLLTILMDDTARHRELLLKAIAELKARRVKHAGSGI